MAIRATCESCDHEFRTRDENAGRRVRCPECGEPVSITAKRGGKSKKNAGGNQTVILAGIAGAVVVVVAIVIGVVAVNGGGANNMAPNVAVNNVAPTHVMPTNIATPQVSPNGTLPASTANNTRTTLSPRTADVDPATAATTPSGIPTTPMPVAANSISSTTNPRPSGPPSGAFPPNAPPSGIPMSSANASGVPAVPGSTPSPNQPNTVGTNGAKPAEMSLADLIEKVEPSVVRIDVETSEGGGNGSGFVIDKSGVIITNYHVIAGANSAVCEFRDGSKAKVEGFLKIDSLRDVAVIKVNHPADKLHPIKLASSLPRKGEKVVAFGAPLGLSWTATEGIISAYRTKPELAKLGIEGIEGDWIQTSTPISPGNSGGPLVTYAGEVVAMNTMQLTIGQNLNFAVQSKEIETVWKQAEGAAVVALAPAALPKTNKSRVPQLVDATKTERGRKALGRLKEVTLLTVMGRDPTGRIRAVVQKRAVDTVKQLGLFVRDGDESDNELMIVTMHFEENAKSKTGAFEVHVSAVVLMRDRNEQGQVEILKVWQQEERLGSMADRLFFTGELSKNVMDKLSSFFGKFKGAFNSAHREADRAAPPGSKSKTK